MLHLFYGLAIAALVLPWAGAARRNSIIRRWSRGLLTALGIRLVVHGQPPDRNIGGAMFVANHVSWADIQAIHSVFALRFVAKREIGGWPVLGRLAACADTLFIDRARRRDAGRIVATIAERRRAGEGVWVFTEGTTSDGTAVLPFKGSLLQAAIDAQAPVWPIAIMYTHADGSLNRQMAYYDEMSLWQSLKLVLAQRSPSVELHFLPPIATAGLERHAVSALARRAIAQALGLAY